MADEIGWLIERADPFSPGAVMLGHFLGVEGYYDGTIGDGRLCWLSNASDALRFARQQDAAMFIGAAMRLMDSRPHAEALIGLRSGDPRAIPVEHMWCDAPRVAV